MAVQFHPLPLEVFGVSAQPYIARLNRELRDVFGLEGLIRSPTISRRSDNTIARGSGFQVDVTRITPSITEVVSGVSTAVGSPALVFGLTNATGTTTTAISITSEIALFGTQVPSNSAATAAAGTSAFAARADHVHVWPEALATLAGSSDNLTLTDDATEGALLSASGSFSANSLALLAPNANDALRIGKYGNISVAGTLLSDTVLCNFSKTDYVEASSPPAALVCQIANTHVGTATGIARGLAITVTGSMAGTTTTTTNPLFGSVLTMSAGNANGNSFLGFLVGHRVSTYTLNTLTAGNTVTLVCGFEAGSVASPLTATRVAITDYMGFRARPGASLLTGASIANNTGFRCEAMTQGQSRFGMDIAAMTTGTPACTYGVRVGTHSVGTVRRAFEGGNLFLSMASDHACDSASRGLITKDTQGTPRYWRSYVGVSGGTTGTVTVIVDALGVATWTRAAGCTGSVVINHDDIGTALPAA